MPNVEDIDELLLDQDLVWVYGGTTDSFGPELRPVTDGLALVPYPTVCTTTPNHTVGRCCSS